MSSARTFTEKFHPLCDVQTYTLAQLESLFRAGWDAAINNDGYLYVNAKGYVVYRAMGEWERFPSYVFEEGFTTARMSYHNGVNTEWELYAEMVFGVDTSAQAYANQMDVLRGRYAGG